MKWVQCEKLFSTSNFTTSSIDPWQGCLNQIKLTASLDGVSPELILIQEEIQMRKDWVASSRLIDTTPRIGTRVESSLFKVRKTFTNKHMCSSSPTDTEDTILVPNRKDRIRSRITELRLVHRMPKSELAQLARLSKRTILIIENGSVNPSDNSLDKIAAVFGISKDDLTQDIVSVELSEALTSPFASTEEVSHRLKTFRKNRRLSQIQFAELAGLSSVYVSEVERELYQPKKEYLAKLEKAMSLDSQDLILRRFSKTLKQALSPIYLSPRELGFRIRALRKATGMSVSVFAKHAGFSQQGTISGIEHGRTNPNDETLNKLATALKVPPQDLILIQESETIERAMAPTKIEAKELGRRLKALRLAKGLKVTNMANISGISFITIVNIEKGHKGHWRKTILKLIEFFKVDVDDLLDRKPSESLIQLMVTNQINEMTHLVQRLADNQQKDNNTPSTNVLVVRDTLMSLYAHEMTDTNFGKTIITVVEMYITESVIHDVDVESLIESIIDFSRTAINLYESQNTLLCDLFVEISLSLVLASKSDFEFRDSILDDIICTPSTVVINKYWMKKFMDYHALAVVVPMIDDISGANHLRMIRNSRIGDHKRKWFDEDKHRLFTHNSNHPVHKFRKSNGIDQWINSSHNK